MNNQSHHDSKHQPIAHQSNISHDTIDGKINPELLNYEIYRQPLWGIHTFVENVLKTDKPGFDIYTNKRGKTVIKELPLSAYYYLINDFTSRIPVRSDPVGFIGLFQECSIELGITNARPIAPGDVHLPGMNGAQLFNTLLELISRPCKRLEMQINRRFSQEIHPAKTLRN